MEFNEGPRVARFRCRWSFLELSNICTLCLNIFNKQSTSIFRELDISIEGI